MSFASTAAELLTNKQAMQKFAAELQAAELQSDDAEAQADEAKKRRRRLISVLLTTAGLATTAGLGYLAYKNKDAITNSAKEQLGLGGGDPGTGTSMMERPVVRAIRGLLSGINNNGIMSNDSALWAGLAHGVAGTQSAQNLLGRHFNAIYRSIPGFGRAVEAVPDTQHLIKRLRATQNNTSGEAGTRPGVLPRLWRGVFGRQQDSQPLANITPDAAKRLADLLDAGRNFTGVDHLDANTLNRRGGNPLSPEVLARIMVADPGLETSRKAPGITDLATRIRGSNPNSPAALNNIRRVMARLEDEHAGSAKDDPSGARAVSESLGAHGIDLTQSRNGMQEAMGDVPRTGGNKVLRVLRNRLSIAKPTAASALRLGRRLVSPLLLNAATALGTTAWEALAPGGEVSTATEDEMRENNLLPGM